MVWRDLGLNAGLPDHWRTLYPLGQWAARYLLSLHGNGKLHYYGNTTNYSNQSKREIMLLNRIHNLTSLDVYISVAYTSFSWFTYWNFLFIFPFSIFFIYLFLTYCLFDSYFLYFLSFFSFFLSDKLERFEKIWMNWYFRILNPLTILTCNPRQVVVPIHAWIVKLSSENT